MADEQMVETGQFSFSGQKYQAEEGFAGYFEPGQLDQVEAHGRLYVVADGLGGVAAGSIAGQYAVKKVLHDFYQAKEPDLEARLKAVIQKVNAEIYERNGRSPERRPMAVALLAALIHQNKLLVANVGDGRVYVVWDKDIEQLGDEPVGSGPDQPSTPGSSPLSSPGLGLTDQVKIQILTRRLFAGDHVVLCSGGLAGYLTQEEIARMVTRFPPVQAGRNLAELAARRGSRDTISVSVTRLLPRPTSQAVLRPAPLPAAPDWETLARPAVRPQPPGKTGTQPLTAGPSYPASQAGRRRLIAAGLILAVMALVAVGGFLAGRAWPARQEAAVVAAASRAEDETGVTGQQPAQTPTVEPAATPTATGQLVVNRNSPLSPLPTPAVTPTGRAGGSTGEVITAAGTAGSAATPVATATPTLPPLPTIALPAGCTNKGRFAGDVTVPDGQKFAPGEPFDKSWSVTNYGTCPWGPGYTLRFVGGDRMGGQDRTLVEIIRPDGTGTISQPMVAPESSGTYRSTWQLVSPAGEAFGPELYVEVEVVPGVLAPGAQDRLTTVYDFVKNAEQASWTAGDVTYSVTRAPINRDLVIPFPEGLVAVGPAEFGGNYQAPGDVLLTHPHQELGYIEGRYDVTVPLQPEDAVTAILGLPKAAVINDDGLTFELVFQPAGGPEQVIFSKLVRYEDSPVAITQALNGIRPGQTGTFILRVRGGDSLSYDWATWIDIRLVRP